MKNKKYYTYMYISVLLLIFIGGINFYNNHFLYKKTNVFKVIKGTAVDVIPGNVHIQPKIEYLVYSEASGKVLSCLSTHGKTPKQVHKNQIILIVDPFEIYNNLQNFKLFYKKAYAQKKLNINNEFFTLQNSQLDFIMSINLFKQGRLSQIEFDNKKNALKNVLTNYYYSRINKEFDLESKKLELEKIKESYKKLYIKTPFSGIITDTFLMPGMKIVPGHPVFKILAKDNLIEISISEEDYIGIKIGQRVKIYINGIKNKIFNGKIKSLKGASTNDSKRRSVYVTINKISDKSLLIPGMTGHASIIKAKKDNTLIVPKKSLLGNFIYTLDIYNKVKIKKVDVGYTDFDYAEILNGLKMNDLVIADNLFNYREGQKLNPKIINKI